MKKLMRIMILMLIFCIGSTFLFSISKVEREKKIKQIESEYKKIDNSIKSYEKKYVEITAKDTVKYLSEGDSVIFYSKNGNLKKVETYSEGVQKVKVEYYIKNEEPFFVMMTLSNEDEDDGTREFYFTFDGELIRVVDDGEIDDSGEYFEKYGSSLTRTFYSISSLIE